MNPYRLVARCVEHGRCDARQTPRQVCAASARSLARASLYEDLEGPGIRSGAFVDDAYGPYTRHARSRSDEAGGEETPRQRNRLARRRTAATDRSRESDSWRAYRLEGARRLLSKGNFTVTDGALESVPPRLYGGTEQIVAYLTDG